MFHRNVGVHTYKSRRQTQRNSLTNHIPLQPHVVTQLLAIFGFGFTKKILLTQSVYTVRVLMKNNTCCPSDSFTYKPSPELCSNIRGFNEISHGRPSNNHLPPALILYNYSTDAHKACLWVSFSPAINSDYFSK